MKIKPPQLRIEFYKDLDESSLAIFDGHIEIYTDKFTLKISNDEEMETITTLKISEKAKKVALAEIIYKKYNNDYIEG